ncbi:hypothetical protein VTK56DRAFT_1890 [Thermocarpiscus australiensis]
MTNPASLSGYLDSVGAFSVRVLGSFQSPLDVRLGAVIQWAGTGQPPNPGGVHHKVRYFTRHFCHRIVHSQRVHCLA